MMVCKTPAALEMAIKAAAKASPLETGRAVSGFYFHRLLCRVFSKPDSPFMLKGGQSMLARTMDARATRDIDLLSEEADLDAALAELRALAEADLGDFVVFEFVGAVPIKVEDEYRSGLKVAFVPLLGGKRLQEVSIDLVADRVACGEPEIVTPAGSTLQAFRCSTTACIPLRTPSPTSSAPWSRRTTANLRLA